MKTIFKVGDRVFDIRFGWGTVKDNKDNKDEFMTVMFDGNEDSFAYAGVNISKLLSFTEYTLQGFSQERPKKEPEIGSLCLFSNNDEEFNNNIGFVGILECIDTQIRYKYKDGDGDGWEFCKQIKIEEI